MRRLPWALLVAGALGCGRDDGAVAAAAAGSGGGGEMEGGPIPGACPPGERELGGRCEPAGDAAGIETCASGFLPDGTGGCEPILPEGPCPPGTMAIPGEAACRAIDLCDDVSEPGAQHVDAGYAGGASDGSKTAPWVTIQDAIDAAADGALVAVAAGVYTGDLVVSGKAVRIVGRCPDEVVISGTGTEAAVTIVGADGSELQGVAVEGPGAGVYVLDSADVILSRVWIHDTALGGVLVEGAGASATLADALVENAGDSGAYAFWARLVVERSAIRGIQAQSSAALGWGAGAQDDLASGARGDLEITDSVIEQCIGRGVQVVGADAKVRGSVIRDIAPSADGSASMGIGAIRRPESGQLGYLEVIHSAILRCAESGVVAFGSEGVVADTMVSDVLEGPGSAPRGWGIVFHEDEAAAVSARGTVQRSVVEDAHQIGIFDVGSVVDVERTLVRDVRASSLDGKGQGISVSASYNGPGRTSLRVDGCRIERAVDQGIFVAGGEATLAGTLVRDTRPHAQTGSGIGIGIQQSYDTKERATGSVHGCVIDTSHEVGLFVAGATVEVESTLVRDTASTPAGLAGHGIFAQYTTDGEPSELVVRASRVAGNRSSGIAAIGSTAEVEDSWIEGTQPDALGVFGDGVVSATHPGFPGSATVLRALVSDNARAGVAVFGGSLALGDSVLWCNAFAIDGETILEVAPALEDLGGNRCGCDAEEACRMLSAGLAAPEALP